jgi:hypothetical protein
VNLSAVGSLTTRPVVGTWFRAIQPQFWRTSLHTSHSKAIPSRFNEGATARPQFEILYLAENHLVALFEVQALLGSPFPPSLMIPHPHLAWTIINVQVQLQRVADLTDVTQQALLRTTAQEITGDWRSYHLRGPSTTVTAPTGAAPTQQLGSALNGGSPTEGFLAISAKVPTSRTLILFPDKLQPGSHVEFSHATLGAHRIAG